MSPSPSIWQTFKKELINIYSVIFIIFIAFFYYSFSVLILNYRLVIISLIENNPLSYKLEVISLLLKGAYYALSTSDFYLLVITSFLVSTNILIVIKTLKSLKTSGGKLTLAVGGSSVLGIFVAGCSSCGFSVISLLGLTGALSFIPFGGMALHTVVIGLLIFSFWYSLRTYHRKIVCKIK